MGDRAVRAVVHTVTVAAVWQIQIVYASCRLSNLLDTLKRFALLKRLESLALCAHLHNLLCAGMTLPAGWRSVRAEVVGPDPGTADSGPARKSSFLRVRVYASKIVLSVCATIADFPNVFVCLLYIQFKRQATSASLCTKTMGSKNAPSIHVYTCFSCAGHPCSLRWKW